MVFFSMSTTNYSELLERIEEASSLVSQRRGDHAAGIWSVNNFLSGLSGGLIEFRDTKALSENGGYLLVAPGDAQAAGAEASWSLFIECPDHLFLAHEASPTLVVAAVRRLPEFLTNYVKQLQGAAGSDHTVSQAKRFVTAVCQTQE